MASVADRGSSDALNSIPCHGCPSTERACNVGKAVRSKLLTNNEVKNLLTSVTHKEDSFLCKEYVDFRSDV